MVPRDARFKDHSSRNLSKIMYHLLIDLLLKKVHLNDQKKKLKWMKNILEPSPIHNQWRIWTVARELLKSN